jgi:hypothetical protein
VGGLVVGLVVGRWWALVVPAGFGVYIALVSKVEVPPVLLGAVYAAISALGVAAGVFLRRRRPS